jgi:hypothetical protein
MAKNVPGIRYAVAATASCHMGNKLQDKRLRMQSLHLRLEATQALRQQLRNDAQETDISLIACMILLAQLDVRVRDSLLKAALTNVTALLWGLPGIWNPLESSKRHREAAWF